MNTRLGEWYPEHIMSYNQYRGDKTVHFLYFEDLKKVKKQFSKRFAINCIFIYIVRIKQ